MDGRRHAPKGGNVHRGAPAGTGSGSKRKSKGFGGGKKPIKVVYIGNPMRVTTSAEGFRALVQELTGRHADPSKYTGGGAGSPVTNVVDDYSLQAEQQPGALPSPGGSGTTEEASNVTANAAAGVRIRRRRRELYAAADRQQLLRVLAADVPLRPLQQRADVIDLPLASSL